MKKLAGNGVSQSKDKVKRTISLIFSNELSDGVKKSLKEKAEEVAKIYEKIFGSKMNLNYGADHNWMGAKNYFAYEEEINLTEFLPFAVEFKNKVDFGFGAKVLDDLSAEYVKKGSTATYTGMTDTTAYISLCGTKTNVTGILCILFLILAIAGLGIFAFFMITDILKKQAERTII